MMGGFCKDLPQKQMLVVPRCTSLSHTPLPKLHTYSLPFATAKPCIQYTFERQMSEHYYHRQPAPGATRLMWGLQ